MTTKIKIFFPRKLIGYRDWGHLGVHTLFANIWPIKCLSQIIGINDCYILGKKMDPLRVATHI